MTLYFAIADDGRVYADLDAEKPVAWTSEREAQHAIDHLIGDAFGTLRVVAREVEDGNG